MTATTVTLKRVASLYFGNHWADVSCSITALSRERTGSVPAVCKHSHSASDLRELPRNTLGPLMEEERAASLRLLDVASSFSSWKTRGHRNKFRSAAMLLTSMMWWWKNANSIDKCVECLCLKVHPVICTVQLSSTSSVNGSVRMDHGDLSGWFRRSSNNIFSSVSEGCEALYEPRVPMYDKSYHTFICL